MSAEKHNNKGIVHQVQSNIEANISYEKQTNILFAAIPMGSVADPDPPDPYHFSGSGSGSIVGLDPDLQHSQWVRRFWCHNNRKYQ